MTEDQIKHMVNRFLGWRLPSNFNPDAGISFKAIFNEHTAHPARHEPIGTNLFDAMQAEEMVRYMVDGMPDVVNDDIGIGQVWQHKQSHGVYEIVAIDAKIQVSTIGDTEMQTMLEDDYWIVYRLVGEHQLFFRMRKEFMDGRFEVVSETSGQVTAAINRAREFEAQDMEYAADLLGDLNDEYPDNQTIVAQWFRKVRTETILRLRKDVGFDAIKVSADDIIVLAV